MIKAITKITKIDNKNENIVRKVNKKYNDGEKKKNFTLKIKNENEKARVRQISNEFYLICSIIVIKSN